MANIELNLQSNRMRFFAKIAYNGTRFVGWQIQPNGMSIQQSINECMSMILRQPIEVTGCGRTDAGVHASQFFLHFDFDGEFPKGFVNRLNKVLPDDIVFYDIFEVNGDAHTRFDARKRSYEYHLTFKRTPFQKETIYYYPYQQTLDFDLMNQAAALLLEYKEFKPFCKTQSDAKTMFCDLFRSEWVKESESHWVFHVSANRFLRGMVRLIVGMCIHVGRGKLLLADIKKAMDHQEMIPHSYSVPALGLFLTEVVYPDNVLF